MADTAVVTVVGELDVATAPDLGAVLGALIDRGHHRIALRCDELTFIDASALGVLARVKQRLGGSAGELSVQGLADATYRVFEITGLVDELKAERRRVRSPSRDDGSAQRMTGQVSRLVAASARRDARATLLSRITELVPMVMARCDDASVTLRHGADLITVAATSETVRLLDGLQYAGRDGPCVEAAEQGTQVHLASAGDRRRWRSFADHARQHSVASVLSTPLVIDDGTPAGALNLYSGAPAGFAVRDRDLATALAGVVSVALDDAHEPTADRLDARIHEAFESRDVIAQAQGVLMERLGVHAVEAFEALRRDSVRTSISLRDSARQIVEDTQRVARTSATDGPRHG